VAETVADEDAVYVVGTDYPEAELPHIIADLEAEMRKAAEELRFEEAAQIRDRIEAHQGHHIGAVADIGPRRPKGSKGRRRRR